ncbi:MAG: ATP-binding cassette domain-containing protein, partial [Clostridia bacterium]|nr:ATP-binding cassette domain-containing protein [Clostridia bacterium]
FLLDVDYRFDKGILAIQGESGAGKTTILNCISGLIMPDDGKIAIGDQIVFDSIAGINVTTRLRNIGYLFQNYALFPNMTVYQNIVYGIKNHKDYKEKSKKEQLLAYADYIMETFGIAHLKKKTPGQISGGEKQRVALSRAIVTKPGLLLLDEPFSALDQRTKEIVYQEFASFKKNFQIPTILITHDSEESKMFADCRIHIKEGVLEEVLYDRAQKGGYR